MNAQTLIPLPVDMTDEMAEALHQAVDLLVEFMGESHPAIVRLSGPLCRYEVAQAQAHIRSHGVRQSIGSVR